MSIDVVIIIFAFVVALLGLVGAFLPVLPGPLLSFSGLALLLLSDRYHISETTMWVMGVIAVVVFLLDFVVPMYGTKYFGGTKAGQWGSMIGLVLGIIFIPPIGIILGPFVGAFVGELVNGKDLSFTLRSAVGSLLGFLAGTLMKTVYAIVVLVLIISSLF